jgi:hypothetical protein
MFGNKFLNIYSSIILIPLEFNFEIQICVLLDTLQSLINILLPFFIVSKVLSDLKGLKMK